MPRSWVRLIWGVGGLLLARLGVNPVQVANFVSTQINKPLAAATTECVEPTWEPSIDVKYDSNGALSTDVQLSLGGNGRPGSVFDAVRVIRNSVLIYDIREFTRASNAVHIDCVPATDPWTLRCASSRT